MSKSAKIWIISATALILMGCIIFSGVMTVFKWDFSRLATVKFETNNYEISEEYKNISVVTNTADIILKKSENSETSVVCYEQKNLKHTVEVNGEKLEIKVIDTRKWYEYIGITIGKKSRITVFLPDTEYGSLFIKGNTGDVEISEVFEFESIDVSVTTGDIKNYAAADEKLKIKTTTGDIFAQNISAESMDFSVSTGDINIKNANSKDKINIKVSTGHAELTDVNCGNLETKGSTGDIYLKNVIASKKFHIERSTGNVKFDGCDATEIFIKTDTGHIKGGLLSEKVFIARSDTGKIDVPKTATGGRCEVETDTGDIKINIQR